MSLQDDRQSQRRRKPHDESQAISETRQHARKKRPASNEVGHALRSAYERMVEEQIPPEMLDLLGKLG